VVVVVVVAVAIAAAVVVLVAVAAGAAIGTKLNTCSAHGAAKQIQSPRDFDSVGFFYWGVVE
jgi:hypothetical protein